MEIVTIIPDEGKQFTNFPEIETVYPPGINPWYSAKFFPGSRFDQAPTLYTTVQDHVHIRKHSLTYIFIHGKYPHDTNNHVIQYKLVHNQY